MSQPGNPRADAGDAGDAIVIDARGLRCPRPVIELGRTVSQIPAGQPATTVEVLADDPAAESDIPAWCRLRGATFEDARDEPGGGRRYRIVVGPD